MKTITDPGPSEQITETRATFFESLPTHFQRLGWNRQQITAYRTERLRALLTVAVNDSPFHRRRLGAIDPSSFELADLSTLPVMTKPEMMAAFDEVVTDRRLTLDAVNRHIDMVEHEPVLLLENYVVLATGGSSGIRGLFVSDIGGAAEKTAAVLRGGLAGLAETTGWPPPGPAPMAVVAAPSCIHATRILPSLFLPGQLATVTFAPVTLPFPDIIDQLQQAQPLILVGYPSMIARLADAQAAGELEISPMSISVTSEQLTTDHSNRIINGFGMPPTNSYGTSEGLMGTAPPGTDVFDFASDLVIIEFVDGDDLPVPPGQAADHILITNLFNTTQPLIRYRIDDVMTPAAPSPNHGHQRATLKGRNDGEFQLGNVAIHPITIRSVLTANNKISRFQVHLLHDNEIHIDVVAADIDLRQVEHDVRTALASVHAPQTTVVATAVDTIARDPNTGKAKEFVTT